MAAARLSFPSRLGLGTWQFCGAAPGLPDPGEAERILASAIELGIRHVDTAQSYGNGTSETVVGGLIENRPDVFVATKLSGLTAISDALLPFIPDVGNIFGVNQ